MSYRRIPELGRAREHMDRTVGRRLRALERRSRYPGAMQVVEADSVGGSTNGVITVASLNVGRGAWVINAACNVDLGPTGTHETAVLSVHAHLQSTGAILDPPQVGPPAVFSMPFTAAADVVVPLRVFGHSRWDEPVRLDMEVALLASSTHAVTVTDICLHATPT